MKTYLYVRVDIKILLKIPENFAFLILGILEIYTRKVCEMFVYKYTETIESVKN